MIRFKHDEEISVALYFADLMQDQQARDIFEKGGVADSMEAIYLARFFWRMVDRSAAGVEDFPFEWSSQFWVEKLHNTIGGYLERAGYESEWNTECDNA